MPMDDTVNLTYVVDHPSWVHEKPHYNFTDLPPGTERGNICFESSGLKTLISDVRGREDDYSLSSHGFTYLKWAPPTLDWKNEVDINSTYLAHTRELVARLLGIDGEKDEQFVITNWKIRNASIENSHVYAGTNTINKHPMVPFVHIDVTPLGVVEWMRQELGTDVANNLVSRCRIRVLNIWRPLVDVVEDIPLAMCDPHTVDSTDKVETINIFKGFTRRNYFIKRNDNHRFYYLNSMTRNEVCVFFVFDSDNLTCAPPHTAFYHSHAVSQNRSMLTRESIEVRMVVVTPV